MDKENKDILLSICIPTYNRAEYLRITLDSIVKQDRFNHNNDIEIVISDNCSDDNTAEVSKEFIEIYGSKIRYFRNPENIKDKNFEKVLSYGKGLFLKLNNDTLAHIDGSLNNLLNTLNNNRNSILFFSNGELKLNSNFIIAENIDEFVKYASFWSTWIAAFGIWKDDFKVMNDFSRYSNLQLTQTDVLFRLIYLRKKVIINNDLLFKSINPNNKGGYDLLTVFLDNYFFILTEYLNNKSLSKKIFIKERKRVLLNLILPWLVKIKINPKDYTFLYKNSLYRIANFCKNDILTFFDFLIRFNYKLLYNLIVKINHSYFFK